MRTETEGRAVRGTARVSLDAAAPACLPLAQCSRQVENERAFAMWRTREVPRTVRPCYPCLGGWAPGCPRRRTELHFYHHELVRSMTQNIATVPIA